MKNQLQQEISRFIAHGITPTLGIIRVGNRPDDVYYENSIIKNCQSIGMRTKSYALEQNIEIEEFTEKLLQANEDKEVHGILIFRPLPSQLDEKVIDQIINPDKDIDGMNPLNIARILGGDTAGLVPCTAAAIMEILKYYNINLKGTNVAVVGMSMVVGKPLSMMLLKENATVTMCHIETKNVPEITKKADVIVVAIGKAKLIDTQYVTPKSIVIDVGINKTKDGRICGDVDYEAVKDKVRAITPVPGGVGSVTTVILLKHVVEACLGQLVGV
ncbi:MAG: bifunctional 5,10-methylenetetrahydrofolate dehydrogenase/5,10-methenyltetrahydrofolate cyclohydrolase [Syntrophomonas sp.]